MTTRYGSMEALLKSISPDVRLPPDALTEPARTDTLLHLALNGALRERDFQAACFERFAALALTKAEYQLIFAIPNGQYRAGQRMEPGLKAGMPDILVPIPRQFTDEYGDTHYLGGLFIELKVGKGKPSALQILTMHRLMLAGYRCCVVWDEVDRVVATIEEYLRS